MKLYNILQGTPQKNRKLGTVYLIVVKAVNHLVDEFVWVTDRMGIGSIIKGWKTAKGHKEIGDYGSPQRSKGM